VIFNGAGAVVRWGQHSFYNHTHRRVLATLRLKVSHTLNRLDLPCHLHRWEARVPKSMTSKQPEYQSTVDALCFVSDNRSTFSGGRASALDEDGASVGRG